MRKLLFILLLPILPFVTGCKKEKKIEKNLWNDGGKWNIESYHMSMDDGEETGSMMDYQNCGTFNFKKDGTGYSTMEFDDQTLNNVFQYVVEDEFLILSSFGGNGQKYDMDWSKDNVTLKHTLNYTNDGETILFKEVIKLRKI